MREIKFRGKDKENNSQWRCGSLVQYPNGNCVIVEFDNDGNELSYEVQPETVGQYTGLKDDHDKEIYEGDIVSILSWKGVVVYNNKHARFSIRCGRSNIDIKNFFVYGGKVIGNIHDNKNLINK